MVSIKAILTLSTFAFLEDSTLRRLPLRTSLFVLVALASQK